MNRLILATLTLLITSLHAELPKPLPTWMTPVTLDSPQKTQEKSYGGDLNYYYDSTRFDNLNLSKLVEYFLPYKDSKRPTMRLDSMLAINAYISKALESGQIHSLSIAKLNAEDFILNNPSEFKRYNLALEEFKRQIRQSPIANLEHLLTIPEKTKYSLNSFPYVKAKFYQGSFVRAIGESLLMDTPSRDIVETIQNSSDSSYLRNVIGAVGSSKVSKNNAELALIALKYLALEQQDSYLYSEAIRLQNVHNIKLKSTLLPTLYTDSYAAWKGYCVLDPKSFFCADDQEVTSLTIARGQNLVNSLILASENVKSPIEKDYWESAFSSDEYIVMKKHAPITRVYFNPKGCDSKQFTVQGTLIKQSSGFTCFVPKSKSVKIEPDEYFDHIDDAYVIKNYAKKFEPTAHGITDTPNALDFSLTQQDDQAGEGATIYPVTNRSISLTSGHFKTIDINGKNGEVVALSADQILVGKDSTIKYLVASANEFKISGSVKHATLNGNVVLSRGSLVESLDGVSIVGSLKPLNVKQEKHAVTKEILGACKIELNGITTEIARGRHVTISKDAVLPPYVIATDSLNLDRNPQDFIIEHPLKDTKLSTTYKVDFKNTTEARARAESLQATKHTPKTIFVSKGGTLYLNPAKGEDYVIDVEHFPFYGFAAIKNIGEGKIQVKGEIKDIQRNQGIYLSLQRSEYSTSIDDFQFGAVTTVYSERQPEAPNTQFKTYAPSYLGSSLWLLTDYYWPEYFQFNYEDFYKDIYDQKEYGLTLLQDYCD